MKCVRAEAAGWLRIAALCVSFSVAAAGAGGCGHTGAERVVLFPSAAHLNEAGDAWQVEVHGWVYQPRGWGLLRDAGFWYLADDIEGDDERTAARALYERRVSDFIVDGRSGRQVAIFVGGERFTSPPTDRAGRFTHTIELPVDRAALLASSGTIAIEGRLADSLIEQAAEAVAEVGEAVAETGEAVAEATGEGVVAVAQKVDGSADEPAPPDAPAKKDDAPPAAAADEAAEEPEPPPVFPGVVRLIGPHGWSVISDVDDTIRQSHVSDKAKMVRYMFVHEYAAVPGMAGAYRRWAEQGAAFHYVTASPSQLFAEFQRFVAERGFPEGVFAMKRIGWFDSFMSNIWASSTEVKPPLLGSILAAWPGRRFILVGDSTEHDPAIYAAVYREHPEQVAHIYIRDVTGEPRDSARYAADFEGVPADRWTLFTDPAELAPLPVEPAPGPVAAEAP